VRLQTNTSQLPVYSQSAPHAQGRVVFVGEWVEAKDENERDTFIVHYKLTQAALKQVELLLRGRHCALEGR
jgi:hypothetical protein